MDSERVNEIRAALDEYDMLGEKSFYEISDHDNIRARNIRDDMPTWLRELLGVMVALQAENARLQAVVDAAREIVADAERPQMARNWATDRLREALAAYEATE